ncbi:MAG: phage coat protein [Eubacterium sp.]|nr:phage coat protein [Eubacterium sp.]
MPGIFDSKLFNAEVFQQYVERIPNLNRNELIRSRAIRPRPDLASAMADEVGGNYITTPLKGLIGGAAQNYDGGTNLTANGTKTFSHSRVVIGRANAWTEKDFSYDITGGEDFLENVAQQISEYWEEVDQATIVHVLNGVFAMSDTEGAKFVESHTNDVTAKQNSEGVTGNMDGTTLNTTMQKACGDNKSKFSLAIMHSMVATNLENLRLLVYLKYNDANGMQRDLAIGTLNGRTVLVDDNMPVITVNPTYAKTSDTVIDAGKTYYTRSGSSGNYVYTAVASPVVADIGNYYEVTGGDTGYVTYVLGDGAIEYTNCGAKVPYETDRDPAKNGGEDTLYSRQRKSFAPYGVSFTKANMSSLSPTDAELEDGANWELVNDNASSSKEYINHKAIPIARIISLG